MKVPRNIKRTAIALALCTQGAFSFAQTSPIMFDPDGTGSAASAISLGMLDWLPGSALAVKGNPIGGLGLNSKVILLSHAKLGPIVDTDGNLHLVPSGEITFVAGFAEVVNTFTSDGSSSTASFMIDTTVQTPNFFEMWWSPTADSNPLGGTGYNNTKRIMYGVVVDSSGNYSGGLPVVKLDQFGANDWASPLVTTITGSGSTQLTGNIVSADADFFPGLTQAQIDTLKVFFNTSTVTPFKQVNPSRQFTSAAGGPSLIPANVGTVNGGLQSAADLNFILQADANQRFDLGEVIEGTCRVTYGGNDKNGNVDPVKFGPTCNGDPKDLSTECYTFGGQVGAPTADKSLGGPFGEHTHHQKTGPAGEFDFHAGTHSAPKNTRITDTACKDPGAFQPAAANAGFKQIDFEGTGSFTFPNSTAGDKAKAFLIAHGAPSDINSDNIDHRAYYFRVDMDDAGEPGNKPNTDPAVMAECKAFFAADQNNPLATPDPLFSDFGITNASDCADVYQILICPTDQPCDTPMYTVRGFLTGGNIQMHKVVK